MAALSQEQIDHLRRADGCPLASEMDEIRAVAERLAIRSGRRRLSGARRTGWNSPALREIAQSADYAIVRQDIEDVRDIDAARRRIAAGTYGVCTDCGGHIGYERLLAYPTAKRCIKVSRSWSRGEGRVHPDSPEGARWLPASA